MKSVGETWFPQDSDDHFLNPSVNDERSRLLNSSLAGFTHSLIGVYINAVQSALSGTLAAVCVSLWDKDSPGTKLSHSPLKRVFSVS